jgi:hypothetical protein
VPPDTEPVQTGCDWVGGLTGLESLVLSGPWLLCGYEGGIWLLS